MFSPAKVVAVGALLVAVGGLLAAQPHGPDIASAPASSPERGATAPAGPDITVVGVEYAFEGLPTSVPAGTSLGLRNEGTEVHELIVYRKNDGVTETWDEILALPEGQYNHLVRFIGNAYAEPGESSFEVVTVALEGDYFAVCLIRQGTTEFDGAKVTFPPDAVPHLLLGMGQGFTVTAAGSSRGPVPMGSSAPIAVGPTSSPAA